MDVLPSDLATYGRDAKGLLKELQSQNERMFLVTFLVLNTGKTEQELETNVFQAVSIAQKHNCELCRLDFQQEQGLMSSLPLADCQIEIWKIACSCLSIREGIGFNYNFLYRFFFCIKIVSMVSLDMRFASITLIICKSSQPRVKLH